MKLGYRFFYFASLMLAGWFFHGVAGGDSVWKAVGCFLLAKILQAADVVVESRKLSGSEPGEAREAVINAVGWACVLPFWLLMAWSFGQPVFMLNYATMDWVAGGLLLAGAGLMLLPGWVRLYDPVWRIRVRAFVFAALLAVSIGAILGGHPYLTYPAKERRAAMAQRVEATNSIVDWQSHAAVLVAHAEDLAREGETERARHFFKLALAGAASDPWVLTAYAEFLEELGQSPEAEKDRALALSTSLPDADAEAMEAPYDFGDGAPLPLYQAGDIWNRHIVCIVGDVGTDVALLDRVGHVVSAELGIPVYRFNRTLTLPEHDRLRGFVDGKQWEVQTLLDAFLDQFEPFPRAPIQYLVITSADIYRGNSNFMFGVPIGSGWALVSYARLGNEGSEEDRLDLLCKQSLSTLIKALGVSPSADPRDVTSYANGTVAMLKKGRRPSPATLRDWQARAGRWAAVHFVPDPPK